MKLNKLNLRFGGFLIIILGMFFSLGLGVNAGSSVNIHAHEISIPSSIIKGQTSTLAGYITVHGTETYDEGDNACASQGDYRDAAHVTGATWKLKSGSSILQTGSASYSVLVRGSEPTCYLSEEYKSFKQEETKINFSINIASLPVGDYSVSIVVSEAAMKGWTGTKEFSSNLNFSIIQPLSVTCSANPGTQEINEAVVWTASPAGGSGTYTYSWSGTDLGYVGNQKSFTHTYSSAGTKTNQVTVYSGGQSASANCSVLIEEADPALNVSCTAYPDPQYVNQNITWTAYVSGGNGTYTYNWEAPGGFPEGAKSVKFNNFYVSGGTKTATITVTSGNQTESSSCTVRVREQQSNPPGGSHDGASGTVTLQNCSAYGWATDGDSPSTRLKIRAKVNGVVVAQGTANLYRSDLDGWCPNASCAFNLDLSNTSIADGTSHTIVVQAEDANNPGTWVDLPNTNKTLKCPSASAGSVEASIGVVDVPYFRDSTVTWNSSNATGCTRVEGSDWTTGNKTSGTLTLPRRIVDENYAVRCTNVNGSQTASDFLSVGDPGTIIVKSNLSTNWSFSGPSPAGPDWVGKTITGSGTNTTYNNLTPGTYTITGVPQKSGYSLTINPNTQYLGAGKVITYNIVYTSSQPTATISLTPSDTLTPSNSGSINISWSSTNANTCSGTNFSTSGNTSGLVASGKTYSTSEVNPTNPVNYKVRCTNTSTGAYAEDTVRLKVQPRAFLSANPSSSSSNPLPYGSATTLTWNSTNATSCTVKNVTDGINLVTNGGYTGSISTGNLTSQKTYSVTCLGEGGTSNTPTLTIYVGSQTASILVKSNLTTGWNITGPEALSGSGTEQVYQDISTGTYTIVPATKSNYSYKVNNCSTNSSCSSNVVTGTQTVFDIVYTSTLDENASVSVVSNIPTTWTLTGRSPQTQSNPTAGPVTYQNQLPGTYTLSGVPVIDGYKAPTISPANTLAVSGGGSIVFRINYESTTDTGGGGDLSCTPSSQLVSSGQNANFQGVGGSGTFSWSAPGGSPATGGNSEYFSTVFNNSGSGLITKTVTVSRGDENASCLVEVAVARPDFDISLDPGNINVPVNAVGEVAGPLVKVVPRNGFGDPVSLSISSVEPVIEEVGSYDFSRSSLNSSTYSSGSNLSLQFTSPAVEGIHQVVVRGTSGSIVRTKAFTVTIGQTDERGNVIPPYQEF